jgi:subtilisin-like proprotein convertase family protein
VARTILAITMAALLVSATAADPGTADGKKRTKTVARSFSSSVGLTVPEAAGEVQADVYPSDINVRGFKKGKVRDVDLTLTGLSHEYTRDLDVMLVAPNGRSVLVMGDAGSVGSSSVSGLDITFDDQARASVPKDPNPLVSGRFRPANYDSAGDEVDFPAPAPGSGAAARLSAFNGIDPNGTWRLFVVDDAEDEDTGSIAGWSLRIKAKLKKK